MAPQSAANALLFASRAVRPAETQEKIREIHLRKSSFFLIPNETESQYTRPPA
jgi:hypothetical protein